MGLIIERHPSDAIRTSKIRITIDKKIKHKLSPGDKVEINIKSEEVIDNVIDELQRARDRILELTDFNYDSLSDDEDLIEDINRSIDRLIDLKGEI